MVNKLARTSRNGSLLFEPEIVEQTLQPPHPDHTMTSHSPNLSSLARSKLNLSVDSKDSFSLHRWVLLKNSIIQSLPLVAAPSSSAGAVVLPDEEYADDEVDSFMFPDAGKLVEGPTAEVNASEAAWLDSLLETLGEDDDDDLGPDADADADVHVAVAPMDDEDLPPSPQISPMSSSDDLTTQSYYPYLDTSDDESEAPPTPGQSLSSLSLDPASIPLPAEHSGLRHSTPHIYIDPEDEYFYPFDPLPFPDSHHTPLTYQAC
ncbi:hypothetical protein C8R43DRAFT_1092531 [Mycena crocata]|nr:hypothetical protein C8R43DRAFT_1092531 [Mycena crocata]